MSEDRTIPEDDWTPAVTLDLYSATSHTFAEIEARFKEWLKNQPLPPLDATTGWEKITPRRAEAWLMHNYKNRKAVFAAIQAYSVPVVNGHWMRTGQTIIFSDEGAAPAVGVLPRQPADRQLRRDRRAAPRAALRLYRQCSAAQRCRCALHRRRR